jgi:hypothetical protein
MSKMIQRSDGSWLTGNEILPKHQHKIMFNLARFGAMNMSQTNRKIHGQNTSTTRAFHELIKKGLIKETGARNYHGRQFPEYWLTGRGLAYVFLHIPVFSHNKYSVTIKGKAFSNSENEVFLNSETLTNYASLFLKDKTIDTYLKLRFTSDRMADFLDYSMFRFGNLSFQEIASYFVMTVNFYGDREALEFLGVTKLPEEFYVALKNNLETIKKFIVMMEKIREK